MTEPSRLYSDKITQFERELKAIKTRLFTSSMLRLSVFLLTALGAYLLWNATQAVVACIFIGVILFFVLVSKHVSLQQQRRRLEALIYINKTEIQVLNRQFTHLPEGKAYKNPLHEFSQDVDLFGKKSFFQYLNRSALREGEQQLAELFTENTVEGITDKQEAIQDLSKKVDFRQEFSASALLSKDEEQEPTAVKKSLKALKAHEFFTPKITPLLSTIFSVLSILLIIAYFTDLIAGIWVMIWLFVGVGITGVYVKKVNLLSDKVSKMQKIFRQYHRLLELLESTEFSSAFMKRNQQEIAAEKKKASQILKEFSKAIDALDQRGNLLFGFLGNGFLLWDLRQSARLEKWMKAYVEKAEKWFEVIALIDAYNSLGNFAFNHPAYTYPKITNNQTVLKAKAAVHPLIPEKEAVTNDVQIDREEFLIITGANMAGKSTFLRTISLQIIMSNVGLPVRAASCEYTPIKLITSMRTVDSLAEEASYFYAELSRLKFIIDKLKSEEYFIVLDEILKGTNSKDKAIGSRKFLEKLVRSHSTGIIATHDLSLCEVAQEMPQVRNHYFDAQIIEDELYFDYQFKTGICQNMNASFLLRKMEIVDDDD